MQGAAADWIAIDRYVGEFESAFQKGTGADLRAFLPAGEDPHFHVILRELIRTDMELRWASPDRRVLADYVRLFPELKSRRESLDAVMAEQARLEASVVKPRVAMERSSTAVTGADQISEDMPTAGQAFVGFNIVNELGRGSFGRVFLAEQRELAKRYVVLKVASELVVESQSLAQLQHTNIVPIYSLHRAGRWQVLCMPFLGAATLADLMAIWRGKNLLPGAGSAMASTLREGIVKTIPANPAGEEVPTTLANVQPANAVPNLNDVDACLWIVDKLAQGLSHAHDRGILHRDIKPANILWADHGQPMLLDFSLAADMKNDAGRERSVMGGTFPYMSPEQLSALSGSPEVVDHRADLYSLGVVLYEVLTGVRPFAKSESDFRAMTRARSEPIRPPSGHNAWVSPATEAIVLRCLKPRPEDRYQSAQELSEDLRRQIENRPLRYAGNPSWKERARKWMRRHPRLASATSVAALASVIVVALAAAVLLGRRHSLGLEARQAARRVHDAVPAAFALAIDSDASTEQLREGVELCRVSLEPFQVLADEDWEKNGPASLLNAEERLQLRNDIAELIVLGGRAWLAGVERHALSLEDPSGVQIIRRFTDFANGDLEESALRLAARYQRLAGADAESESLSARADAKKSQSPRGRLFVTVLDLDRGKASDSLPFLLEATKNQGQNHVAWLTLGKAYASLGKFAEAVDCYDAALAIRPDFVWSWIQRGMLHAQRKAYAHAEKDFEAARSLRPELLETWVNLALVRLELGETEKALADVTHSIDGGISQTRVYFIRSKIHAALGDDASSKADFERGLEATPTDEESWIARGIARLPSDEKGALADFDEALKVNPRSRRALQNKAHVFAERQNRLEDALACLDKAIEISPENSLAYAGRAVLHARKQDRASAHGDVERALKISPSPLIHYQAASVYALTSTQNAQDRLPAIRHLQAAVQADAELLKLVRTDRDLLPLAAEPQYQAMVFASQAVFPPPPMEKK